MIILSMKRQSYAAVLSVALIMVLLFDRPNQTFGWSELKSSSCTSRRQILKQWTTTLTIVTSVAFQSSKVWADTTDSKSDGDSTVVPPFQDGPKGLRYQILREGDGLSPVRGQQIYAKYTLWTGDFNGKKVDSNAGLFSRSLPVIVGIGRVIKGWDITLVDMKVGEVRRVIVPSDIGYGDKGAGASIPPKSTLYFEIEIVDMDGRPRLTDAQQKWLDENPLF